MRFGKKRKAEMFIITMIFLIGFVFAVQQNLLQYSVIDISEPLEENDVYLLWNIRELFNESLLDSADCLDAGTRMQGLKNYMDTQILRGGYALELNYTFMACEANWGTGNNILRIDVKLVSETTETIAAYYFSNFIETPP